MKKWFIALIAAVLAFPVFGSAVLAESNEDRSIEVEALSFLNQNGNDFLGVYSDTVTLSIEDGVYYIEVSVEPEIATTGYVRSVSTINDEEIPFDGETFKFEISGDYSEPIQFKATKYSGDYTLTVALNDDDIPEDFWALETEENTDEETGTVEGTSEDDEETGNGEGTAEDDEETGTDEGTAENDEETGNGEGTAEDDEETGTDEGTADDNEETGTDEGTTEDDEGTGTDEDTTENNEGTKAVVADDAFTVDYIVSAPQIEGFFDNPAVLLVKDGKQYIQITGTGGNMMASVTINGEEVTWVENNADGTFTIQFELEGSLTDELDLVINVQTPGYSHVYEDLILSFDKSTQKQADPNNYNLVVSEDDNTNDENDNQGNVGTGGSGGPGNQNNNDDGNGEPKEEPKNHTTPDKAYRVDFTFYHEDENKPSAADNFFIKPAVLLEKDGIYYVQVTTSGNEYIDSLSNRYGDFLYVGVDADGNHIYQFRIDGELSDVQNIDMVITVPGIYDGEEYTTRFILDLDTMEEVNAENYELVASDESGNGPNTDGTHTVSTVLDPKTPSKPELGDPEEDSNAAAAGNNSNGEGLNPKTGENTNIMFYVLLMIASAIPLVIKARRHFA